MTYMPLCLLFIFYLFPCLHLLISWQFSLCQINFHTQHGWWFVRPKRDVPATEFQLKWLQDFLHLIGRSVKQISLAKFSKNKWKSGGYLFHVCHYTHNSYECNVNTCILAQTHTHTHNTEHREAGQPPAYTHCLFWTHFCLIYTC